jgi:hypothetical protein
MSRAQVELPVESLPYRWYVDPAVAAAEQERIFRRGGSTRGTSASSTAPAYPEQWIATSGLRGCFAYVHTADPQNRIYESNERNNQAQVVVRLPFNPNNRRGGCRGQANAPARPAPRYEP